MIQGRPKQVAPAVFVIIPPMLKQRKIQIALGLLAGLVLAVVLYNVPFINTRLAWRVDSVRAQIQQMIDPPSEKVFVPQEVADAGNLPAPGVTIIAPPTATLVFTETPTPDLPTPTPTITPTPLPERADLKGAQFYVDQKGRWNYCAPANLTMSLKFWGWAGLQGRTETLRDQVAMVIKPGVADPTKDFIERGRLDLNVMPYEMADFVNEYTDYTALIRHGGDLQTLKALVSAGFPPVVEKGYFERDTQGSFSWMGHYMFVTGYDDAEQVFIVQDSYYRNDEKPRIDRRIKYDELFEGWRSFNYLFMVVYPPDRENEVLNILGPLSDPTWSYQRALQVAEEDITTQQGIDLFFAWFNKGTSHVQLLEYGEAATAYDRAFSIYPTLDQERVNRPYRMVWYQTGPYFAYFYTGRYQDVINLANVTLSTTTTGPTLEESLYWRAMAAYALGDSASAFADMRESVRLNPNFSPGLQRMREWGISP
jgi:tetratricopeptide (TPR) repeat protein